MRTFPSSALLLATCLLGAHQASLADAVTDWNAQAGQLLVQSKLGTPPAVRVIALVQTAVHEAVSDAQRRQRGPDNTVTSEAAIAAANHITLLRLLPQQESAIKQAYRAAIDKLGDSSATSAGIAVGEQAAQRVLAWRADDGAAAPDQYRPHAAPGAYVPTTAVAAPNWGRRKPWLMSDGAQFRPAPPPALESETWARDYEEVRTIGARASTLRTAAQTDVACFWDFSLPPIYHGVLRSVANTPGRGLAQNARLYAAASQAMDDAMIAVLDAKYHYGFWRPVTAIRNGDRDNNAATQPEAGWLPLIDNPGHPEYPSAHSILASAVSEVIKADARGARLRELSTSSPSANGATRRWTSLDDFMNEVANARVWAGIHFRTATRVGQEMGRKIGALAVARVAEAPADAGVPSVIAPQKAAKLRERVYARGVQVYECLAVGQGRESASWAFVGPDAILFDDAGTRIGTHGAGPHWQALDNSRVEGKVEARTDAPRAGDIPWLGLSARSTGPAGRFADVTWIQRVNTQGGSAPQRPCSPAEVGSFERVPYTADYLLFAG